MRRSWRARAWTWSDPEPLPAGNAMWKFPNAIVTPHIAGRSDKDRGTDGGDHQGEHRALRGWAAADQRGG